MKNFSLLFILLSGSWQLGCQHQPATADILQPSPLMCTPPLVDAAWYTQNTPAPLLEGMDILHFPITTKNPEAQKFFDQGLLLAYAFNHAEAARSFYQATRLDSTCAMCYWGFAFVLGPNYNAGMEPDNYERAYTAVRRAAVLSASATPLEKALIAAMTERYSRDVPDNRRPLDSAYMLAMKSVHARFPRDVDVAALYAESLMDMHPWDLWDKDGTPRPWTPEIIRAIEVAIGLNPQHPGGHHFYIHAWEASSTPEKALPSAKVFDDGLVAHAGHLVHMPSHIYINTGDYHLGSLANLRAVAVDSAYVTQCHAQGAYPLAYYPHNYHFLAATATLEGKRAWAVMAAKKMEEQTRHKGMLIPELATLQHYNSIPYFIYVKFAMWDEILGTPPLDSMPLYLSGIRHYARGMAYVGKGDLPKAKSEWSALDEVAKADTLRKLTIWEINSLHDVITIAEKVLAGEIAAAEKKVEESIALLQEGVALEDQLNYNEPPDWFFSVRHHLGAVMLEAGRDQDAVRVFLEDLQHFPKNGWALHGLQVAYTHLRQTEEAQSTERLFKEAWANADVGLITSRLW